MSNLSGFVKRLRDIMRNDAGINGDAQRIEQIAWMLFLKVYDAKEQDWEFDDTGYVSIIPEACRWQNWAHDDKSGTALTGDQLLDFVNNTISARSIFVCFILTNFFCVFYVPCTYRTATTFNMALWGL